MTLTPIISADAFKVEDGCYTVVAYLGGGKAVYHQGPVSCAFFTKVQAELLASRISRAGAIDLSHWDDGKFPDMTIRDLEDEYHEREG
jgi:hypothetical protein